MHNHKKIKLLIFTILLGIGLSACSVIQASTPAEFEPTPYVDDPSAVSVTGVVVPETFASLSVAASGLVEDVLVSAGESIAAGQELITLSGMTQIEAALAAAQLELATAQQAYDDLNRNADSSHAQAWQVLIEAQTARVDAQRQWQDLIDDNIEDRIADREVDVQERKDDLESAQEEFDKYKDLDNDNVTRKRAEDNLETAQKAYDQAVWDLEDAVSERDTIRAAVDHALAVEVEAKRQFDQTLDGPDAEALALLEARLSNAKSQVEAAQSNLNNLSLLAPFAGTVAELNVKPGEWAAPGQPVLILADLESLEIETTDLNEVDIAKIRIGDSSSISFDALPELTISGVVKNIAPKASFGSGVNYTITISLDEIPEQLRWGMTAYVDFKLDN